MAFAFRSRMSMVALRIWVGIVGVVALLNALQCYQNKNYARDNIFQLAPKEGNSITNL